jgi:hypothetical protein
MPTAIAIPGTIKSGCAGSTYLTAVFELEHRHDGWQKLKGETRERAFADMTSIRGFVGVKVSEFQPESNVFRARPFAHPRKSSPARQRICRRRWKNPLCS